MEYSLQPHEDQKMVIALNGRLDASSADEFREAFKAALDQQQYWLVVDMAQVSFIDSSGLSALVSGFKGTREHHGNLVLANVGAQAKVALKQTRLDQLFTIYEDVSKALQSVRK